MTSSKGIMCIAALGLLAFVCYDATRSDAAGDPTATHAVAVGANGGDTASIPDFDGDGTIGFGDFLIFAGVFGQSLGDEKYDARVDLNGDGEIGFSDFVIFVQNFGKEVPSPVVAIPDANLRAAIEAALDKASGEASGAPITQAEMATLDSLEANDADISDLTGLEYATNLTWLDLASNNITNISVLEGLTNLTDLILSENNISDLASLAANSGLGRESQVDVTNNPLNAKSLSTHIPALVARGVSVSYVPSPIVTIPDANLRAAIEAALDKATGAPITQADMQNLNSLDAPNVTNGPGIRDLTGLAFATNLTRLNLRYNRISDLSPMSDLTNLTYLNLTEVHGSLVQGADRHSPLNLSPLSGLFNLTYLVLGQNKISDLSPLAGLANLTNLNLESIHIIWDELNPPPPLALSPLSDLTNLTNLVLWGNSISVLSSLSGLITLTSLDLSRNRIKDLSPLSGLTNLTYLDLSQNNVTDVSPLAELTELREVFLSVNYIFDLNPLFENAGLASGATVDVKNNPLNDASKNTLIPALRARGVTVSFDEVIAVTDPQIYNDNVFVLPVAENLAGGNLPLKDYAARFYSHFNDAFDFLMFVPNLPSSQLDTEAFKGAYYGSVKNDVRGIGKAVFSDGSWDSERRLQGVVNFGSNSLYSISESGRSTVAEGPTLHELMHRWANSIVPSSYGGHWGFSSANGNIGGFDIAELVNHGVGRYSAGAFSLAGSADNIKPYSPIEMYLAGFIPPEEVPDLWVAEDGEWLRDAEGRIVNDDNGNPIFTESRVTTYTIEDIIAKHGPRVPGHTEAQKDFRAVVILLISEAYPATREILDTVTRDVAWFSHAGPDESYRYNFYEASGGRATITMDGLSQFKRSAGANKPAASSFGTPHHPSWTIGKSGTVARISKGRRDTFVQKQNNRDG